MLCTVALLWLAFVVHNDWSEFKVLIGLVLFGIGQGALVTLVFNVLVTSSPKELAGDVGSLRGTTNNLAAAVGTAVAGALLVGLLSALCCAPSRKTRSCRPKSYRRSISTPSTSLATTGCKR
jgi:MFS family permease